ncbi:MFS transporter [Microbacterium album]|nr:MFS transporter [Microbacterium album]
MSDVGLRSERGPILLALMLVIFLFAIDATVLSTAVTTIVGELGDFASYPWLFSAYLLGQVSTVPVYAKLGDTLGRRPVIFTGIGLFIVSSVLCATAWDMGSLIAFRALQGLGAGAIMPMALTIAGDIYTVRERARVQAYLSSMWAIAAVSGPTIGGLFAQFLSWRWIFWVNLPLGLLALFMLWRNYRESFTPRPARIDAPGALLLTAALVLLAVGVLESGNAWEWASWQTVAVFGGGAVLLTAFVLVERRAPDPIIAPWVVRSGIVRSAALVSMTVGMVTIGIVSYTPTFLAGTLGVPPVASGLTVATLLIGWPLAGALAGRVYLRVGFRRTIVMGAAIVIIGTIWLAVASSWPSIPLTAIGCFIVGIGLGLSAGPSLIAAQSSVATRRRGVVSGTYSLSRSMGSSLGVAVFGAVATAMVAARGGADVPGAVGAGGTGVYIGAGIAAVLMLATAAVMPHVPIADAPTKDDAAPEP